MKDYISGSEFGLPVSCNVHRLANIAGELTAGENCRIDAFVTITGRVSLGKNCHLSNGCAIFGGAGFTMGDDSGLSPGAQVFTTSYDGKTRHLGNPQVEGSEYLSATVTIGARCIIGANSVVLPGAVIYDDTCIGALSMVKEGAIHGLCVGIPARRVA